MRDVRSSGDMGRWSVDGLEAKNNGDSKKSRAWRMAPEFTAIDITCLRHNKQNVEPTT